MSAELVPEPDAAFRAYLTWEACPEGDTPYPVWSVGPVDPSAGTVAFRAPDAARIAGASYRQVDYWDRIGLITPSLQGAGGSGSQRLYSRRDVDLLRAIRRLLDAGLALQRVRAAIAEVREAYPDGTDLPPGWSADLAPGVRVVVSGG